MFPSSAYQHRLQLNPSLLISYTSPKLSYSSAWASPKTNSPGLYPFSHFHCFFGYQDRSQRRLCGRERKSKVTYGDRDFLLLPPLLVSLLDISRHQSRLIHLAPSQEQHLPGVNALIIEEETQLTSLFDYPNGIIWCMLLMAGLKLTWIVPNLAASIGWADTKVTVIAEVIARISCWKIVFACPSSSNICLCQVSRREECLVKAKCWHKFLGSYGKF